MKRRDFLALAGAAAAFPRVALAQHTAELPVIGYMNSGNEVATKVGSAFANYMRGLTCH